MKRLLSILFLTIIISCGGGGGGIFAEDITVRWDHTGLDINGQLDSLDHFIIWWGTESGNYTDSLVVPLGAAGCSSTAEYPFFDCSQMIIPNASPGTYYVTAQAVDVAGNISANAIEAVKTISPPDIVPPANAENMRF